MPRVSRGELAAWTSWGYGGPGSGFGVTFGYGYGWGDGPGFGFTDMKFVSSRWSGNGDIFGWYIGTGAGIGDGNNNGYGNKYSPTWGSGELPWTSSSTEWLPTFEELECQK